MLIYEGVPIKKMNIRYFYRNIIRSGNKYRIKHKNKDYGEFSKLTDALYERDCLIYCNFDYDLLVECDLKNKYENMELPPFPKKRPTGQIKNVRIDKEKREGKIEFNHTTNRFSVVKEEKTYGSYQTMTEAYYVKKKLMESNWDINCLKSIPTIKQDISINRNIKINKNNKILFKYCPKCKNRLKEGVNTCPYCGVKIEDYEK